MTKRLGSLTNKTNISYLFLAIALAGCATNKEWSATGGSRADGIVVLSYEQGGYEQPILNENQGLALAAARCKRWGYIDAEAFGSSTRICIEHTSGLFTSSCVTWKVDKKYQCTGTPDK